MRKPALASLCHKELLRWLSMAGCGGKAEAAAAPADALAQAGRTERPRIPSELQAVRGRNASHQGALLLQQQRAL